MEWSNETILNYGPYFNGVHRYELNLCSGGWSVLLTKQRNVRNLVRELTSKENVAGRGTAMRM